MGGVEEGEVLGGADVPLVVEEDLVAAKAEECLVLLHLGCIVHFPIAESCGFEEIAGDIIFSLEGFVIVSHPVIRLITLLNVNLVGINIIHLYFKS